MGYGIVLVMKRTFEDSKFIEGRVVTAMMFERLTKDRLEYMEGDRFYEDFNEETGHVGIRDKGFYEVDFYPNIIRVRTSLQWSTFLDWDRLPNSPRKEFQKLIDLFHPQKCWIGTDYATDQVCSLEVGFGQWLKDVRKEYGPIRAFDFEKVYEGFKKDIWPKDLYYVKDNKLV